MGPHEANLRGELALAQIRVLQESPWPGLQGDLELRRVREIAQAEVVPIDAALSREGGAYGVRISPGMPLAPAGGSKRAWP